VKHANGITVPDEERDPVASTVPVWEFPFCFVNVDGNGVLHYSSSSPKSNRQGSLFSFLLPKSFALFVALASSRRRRVQLVVSKTDLCSVLFCCSSCCSKRSGKEILFFTHEEKSKAYNNFLMNASLSLSLHLSLSLSLWRKGGEEENDLKLLVIIAARLEKSFVRKEQEGYNKCGNPKL